MAHRTETTLLDKLLLLPLLAKVLVAVFFRAILTPFNTGPKGNGTKKDLIFAALRTFLGGVNSAQEHWLNSLQITDQNYLDFAKKQKFEPETSTLESGLKLHWLGPKTASRVLLYFHGGGYAMSCSPGHFQWLFDLQNDISKDISIVVPSYAVTPAAQYPTQLKQAAEALHWLIEKQGRSPREIVLGGDSAGGNLCMALLSHILHPHPDAIKIHLRQPLASAILISPWVKFATDDPSWTRNASTDMFVPTAGHRWTDLFLGSSPKDNYNEPIRGNSEWYSDLDKIVSDVLIWGGGGEVLIDSIRDFSKTIEAAHSKTKLVVEPGAGHEEFIFDANLGYKCSFVDRPSRHHARSLAPVFSKTVIRLWSISTFPFVARISSELNRQL
ncbi:unnamed protein product [Zymoseptoria tritici ST99CH_3D7]|uniref:Alpha/beta hydrolase fold-3 domain-containing protein n=1 Tax=Zymoseptoria tritici (strain ST99CH_3D7) TaxID=1276538 RepID=A0A1X7RFD7_ZYMT9|nr:unnamed protein product [Zymoseptoria tritici ST99CH_3D7]